MDHELKQRLIGAVVVTALAAIFIPMLFDDPVDTSGKTVTELTIPEEAPADSATADSLPADKAQVLSKPDSDLSVSEEDVSHPNAPGDGQPLTAGDTGSDIGEGEPVVDSTATSPAQNEAPALDTGVVEEADQPNINSKPAVKATDSAQQLEQNTIVKEVEPKSQVAEKQKNKSVDVADKPKKAVKPQDGNKTQAKLVRWSIQAGSFNKKENAQTLVDKLRKQGLPATIVTKGDLFRVKVGPALDKKKAADMKAVLDKQKIQSYLQSE